MKEKRSRRRPGLPGTLAAVVAASLAMAWSCSGDNEAPPGGSGGKKPAVCRTTTALTIESLTPRPEAGWFEAKATGGGKEFTLRLEMNEDAESERLQPGKYSLGTGVDADYATCQRCVLLLEGSTETVEASRVFFSVSGTMTLDAVSSPVTASSRGKLSKVVLHEATFDAAEATTKPKSNGACYELAAAEWDTEPKAGGGCTTAADCGDPDVAACDLSGKCVVRQCDFNGLTPCAEGYVCLAQNYDVSYGVCYERCNPASNSCSNGLECVPLDADATEGKCLPAGTAQEGQPCEATGRSTGCAPGLLCAGDGGEGPVCRAHCSFFGSASCGGGQHCLYGDICSAGTFDAAKVDGACAEDAAEGTPCGLEGGGYRGACILVEDLNNQMVCRRLCIIGGEGICPDGQFCTDAERSEEMSLSVCQPAVAEPMEGEQ